MEFFKLTKTEVIFLMERAIYIKINCISNLIETEILIPWGDAIF